MAAHLTAEAVASALARRRTTSALDALAGIDEREHEAVADALAGVSPKAKIDVPLLVRTIRDRLRARDEAEEARRAEQADPFGYSLSLMSLDELHALKRALEGGATVEEAMVAQDRGGDEMVAIRDHQPPRQDAERAVEHAHMPVELVARDALGPQQVGREGQADRVGAAQKLPHGRRLRWRGPHGKGPAPLVATAAR